MDIERYKREDKLADLELENIYNSSTEKERIEITRKFNEKYGMPEKWASLTIKYGSLQEKIALARYSSFLNEEVEELLKNDKDILVRCALLENENFSFVIFQDEDKQGNEQGKDSTELNSFEGMIAPTNRTYIDFAKLSHLERIALMRNPRVDRDLIRKIYDIDNNRFQLKSKMSNDERKELIYAFCRNKEFIEDSKKGFFDDSYTDVLDAVFITGFYDELYDLATKWLPKDPEIARITYGTFSCLPNKKLEIYNKIKDDKNLDLVRSSLFDSIPDRKSLFDSDYNELFKLGLYDSNESIRAESARNIYDISRDEIAKLLENDTKYNNLLRAFMENCHLDLEAMKFIYDKIEKISSIDLTIPERRWFKERYRRYLDINTKKKNGAYWLESDVDSKSLEDMGDFSKESYKILYPLKNYFKEHFDSAFDRIIIKINWIYWIVLAALFILIFIKR